MKLSLVVDFGTTNVKAGIVDAGGQILAQDSKTVELMRPETGGVEHDPEKLYSSFVDLVREVTAGHEDDVQALVFSGYHFGFMPMDENDEPLMGMVTLLDTRNKFLMEKMEREFPYDKIYNKTGCPPLFTYILARLVWLKEEKPEIFAKSSWFADIKSYFIHKLCGRAVTEPSIASVTQMFNLNTRDWDPEIMSLVGIDESYLPEVVSGDQVVAELSSSVAKELGLNSDVKIVPGVYDGGSMIIGMGGYDSSVGICNLGTTAMFRSCSEEPLIDDPQKKRLQSVCLTDDRYAIGGGVNNAGVSLRWLRDNLSKWEDYQKIVESAEDVPAGSEGLFCFPFLTGERDPRIGSLASGSFFGIKEYHTFKHVSRALQEGVGYTLNMIREALFENNVKFDKVVIGGTASKDDIWCQILADIFDIKVVKSLVEDSSLIGGAILAAKATGDFTSINEAQKGMINFGKEYIPNQDHVEKYHQSFDFFKTMVDHYQSAYQLHEEYFG